MTRIVWGGEDRLYEYGVDRGVLYISGVGIPWNGLTGVEENPGDVTSSSYYFDGIKTLVTVSSEDFSAHVKAYFAPEEFEDHTKTFDFVYRTKSDNGYKIHLVYNCLAAPSKKGWQSGGEKLDNSEFEWDFYTTPVSVMESRPTAHLIIDSMLASEDALSTIEDSLYGTATEDPVLLSTQEIIDLFLTHALLTITDHGDGTWTASGPDSMVYMLDGTSFEINSPSANYLSEDTYRIGSF